MQNTILIHMETRVAKTLEVLKKGQKKIVFLFFPHEYIPIFASIDTGKMLLPY